MNEFRLMVLSRFYLGDSANANHEPHGFSCQTTWSSCQATGDDRRCWPSNFGGWIIFAGPVNGEVLFSENFESLEMMEPFSESEFLDFDEAWTDVPPFGWVRDNTDTPAPDPDDPFIGPNEFYGFTFVDKDWWITTAEDQERSFFDSGDGVIMVADPDEYDDQPKEDGSDLDDGGGVGFPDLMNVFITTPSIVLVEHNRSSAKLSFDSSFRPYDFMTGLVDVSYDGGNEWKNLLTLDLDAFDGVNSSLDRVDERIDLNLAAPATADSAMIRFGLVDAGNDWWWAIDNIEVTADVAVGLRGDFNGDGVLDASDIDMLTAEVIAGTNAATFDVTGDNVVDQSDRQEWVSGLRQTYFGDSNLDGEFSSSDFVFVFDAGQYEDGIAGNSRWAEGDWNGDNEFSSGDFVIAFQEGGYEQGPRALSVAVPEPTTTSLLCLGAFSGFAVCIRRRKTEDASEND